MPNPIRNICFVFFYTGLIFYTATNVLAADRKLDSLNSILSKTTKDSKKAEIFNLLAIYTISSDYRKSLSYAQQTVKLATKLDDHSLLMSGYKNIASVFFYAGIYDEALHYFELCAGEAFIIKNEFERLNCQINQALIYSALGDYKKAIPALMKGRQLLESTYQSAGKPMPTGDFISIRLNMAYNYIAAKDYVKAYLLLDSGIATARLHANQAPLLVKLLQLKAKSLLDEKKVEAAISNLREVEVILKVLNDKTALVLLKGLWAKAYDKMNDYENAIRFFRESFNEAIAMESLSMKTEYANELYKIFNKRRQADSAIRYFNLYTAYEKELNNSKTQEELIRKELIQEFSARELALVAKQAALSQRIVYILVGGAFLLAILMGWLLFFVKRSRRADLQKFKIQLEAERLELEQKKLIARVSHQEKQLADLEYNLSKNAMLENLVAELQSLGQEERVASNSEVRSSETDKGTHQAKIWDEFEIRFLKTHAGFFDNLLSAYPGLTVNERRLCAFLRLDMTTKEIAVITGQSIRAIEIARTRLRKKLNLTETEKSLFEELSSF